MTSRRRVSRSKTPKKLKFLLDRDASGTAGTVAAMGWRSLPVPTMATDVENARYAIQHGLSILTMDSDFGHFHLSQIPFTVRLGAGANQSASTATAQLHQLHRMIRIGEIRPTEHQRVTLSDGKARVETLQGGLPNLRTIKFKRKGSR